MIPIQNLYFLLLYAWDALEEAQTVEVAAEPETKLLDLLAAVLHRGVDHLLRRGIDRGYLAHREAIPGIRGKLDLAGSIKTNILGRGHSVCEFDEFSHDVLPNRILKATLRRLLRTRRLDSRLRNSLRVSYHRLHEVSDIALSLETFRSVHLHRNNQIYRFLLDVCRLLHQCLIPNQLTGELVFREFLRDERRMRGLFERFIRNFLRREQSAFRVEAEPLRWEITTGSPGDLAFLPGMRTDVTLRRPAQTLVIDAKYYKEPLQEHRGRWTVRSGHLYQIFTYLKNIAARGQLTSEIEGLLLYPQSARALNLSYQIHGHRVRVRTIDLKQPWPQIRNDLLALLPSTTKSSMIAETGKL
jgi:5-methylcytosine-specific restriction enzyme subunit McrC